MKRVLLLFFIVLISSPEICPEKMEDILRNTAQYCEKLERAILHFYCVEKVTQVVQRLLTQYPEKKWGLKEFLEERRIYYRRRIKKRWKPIKNSYTFDYQIIKNASDIRERRILINENGKKTYQPDPPPKTVLYSFKNTLVPILLLSKQNQRYYTFSLEGEKTVLGRKSHVTIVRSKSRPEDENILAIVWIDSKDYSILKFEVFPGAIKGYNNLLRINKHMMSDIKIKDTHLFGYIRNGIRYPSKTEISLSFKMRAREKSEIKGTFLIDSSIGKFILYKISTAIRYKNYKFFNVTVNTDFKDMK